MRTGINIRYLLCCILLILSFSVRAATPVWTITPLTSTSFIVTSDSIVTVQYRVLNQSSLPHVLEFQPVTGINQITSTGFCANPFTLTGHQSCILNLQIQGSALQGNISNAPVICESGNTLLCFQPPAINRIAVTLQNKINLTVDNSPLNLIVGGGAGSITIINPSNTITVTNLQASLTGTSLSGNVTQNSSNCSSLPPGKSCSLIFTPINAVTLTSFPITGTNANPAAGQIIIAAHNVATISVTGSPLTLHATTGTPVTGSLTITNQSTVSTANNITGDISGTLATAGVTENSSNCNAVLPLQTCQLVFTPGSQAASNVNIPIIGTNTSAASANISVNGAPQATITLTTGSPLLLHNTGGTGMMTIKNNSTTEKALSIASNFTSTALNGFVTESSNTCGSVNPGATCTLTFTPGTTNVAQTSFPIQGSNTTSVNGAISISTPGPPYIIYVTTTQHHGNFGGFAGGDAICNSDPGKPSTGFAAGYAYKALLNGNNATTTGINYYKPDGTTLLATATGGNLVGNSPLVNTFNSSITYVWTGGNVTSCSTWTSTSSEGSVGLTNSANGGWYYNTGFFLLCSTGNGSLYCVSQ